MMDNLQVIEAHMRRLQLRVYPRTLDSETLALPPLVSIFVRLVGDAWLPTQEAFLRAVVAQARDLPEDGVRARASRAYPALVRQQHFAVALRTRVRLEGVHWVPGLDVLGVDLLVLDRGLALGVALSIRTDTAAFWQHVKTHRHPGLSGLEMIALDVDPDRADKVGPFWVHPLSDVWRVQEAMERLSSSRREALAAMYGKAPERGLD